ncbi:putative F-box protein At5g60060 isoform X1 [Eucalyptus grandis]|uniref:putative F-box protein At5g60060 isoform X1 n=1 Tax=Eucalyptus grandis TaxID=71139 RepID=UPI00192EF400|nr:putative F-box protein At5g60060 isoform X1 [Eucalyptus grandis]XP_010033558.2 putative F-box protein At5g60060 isoform X1 [Eucalyptus grandis]XP_039159883.1 putative F-box protein At5g60060 isoform X1 [Eucalyptus grandis]
MDPTERRSYSDLPPDVLSVIGNRLDTRMEVLGFRSVCSSFRSAIPAPPRREASRFPLQIEPGLFLRESTVYALETPNGAAGSGRTRWLLMLEESSEPGRMRIRSLYSQRRIMHMLPNFPKVLDSRQSRMVEICRQYTLDGTTRDPSEGVQKAVMHPDGVGSDLDQCSVYFIEGGELGCWKYRDENWSNLEVDGSDIDEYDDIVVYDGKVWVVDSVGQIGQILQLHTSFRLQSFSLPIYDIGRRFDCFYCFSCFSRHLVVSGGDLYIVCRYTSDGTCSRGSPEKTSHYEVFRLDQRHARWDEVRSLGDSAFFLCNCRCSFAVPASELDGHGEGNCIYRAERNCNNFEVFNLVNRSLEWPAYSDFRVGLLLRATGMRFGM